MTWMTGIMHDDKVDKSASTTSQSAFEWVVLILSFFACGHHLRKSGWHSTTHHRCFSGLALFHIVHVAYCATFSFANAVGGSGSGALIESRFEETSCKYQRRVNRPFWVAIWPLWIILLYLFFQHFEKILVDEETGFKACIIKGRSIFYGAWVLTTVVTCVWILFKLKGDSDLRCAQVANTAFGGRYFSVTFVSLLELSWLFMRYGRRVLRELNPTWHDKASVCALALNLCGALMAARRGTHRPQPAQP